VLLFEALLEEMHDEDTYIKKVQEAMSTILRTTKDYTAMVMGTVMEIALYHGRYIALEAEDIAAGIFFLVALLPMTVVWSIKMEINM
jgi:hypothetical protein